MVVETKKHNTLLHVLITLLSSSAVYLWSTLTTSHARHTRDEQNLNCVFSPSIVPQALRKFRLMPFFTLRIQYGPTKNNIR